MVQCLGVLYLIFLGMFESSSLRLSFTVREMNGCTSFGFQLFYWTRGKRLFNGIRRNGFFFLDSYWKQVYELLAVSIRG